jgi:two-component system sensor histidine kinase DegS
MMDRPLATEGKSPFKQVLEQVRQEYERTQNEIRELDILIRQSSAEVDKLTQRNAQVANRVRQMEESLDTVPRQDIREAYTVAQETQTRLFMMRGQMEQLQAKQQVLERHAAALRLVLEAAGQETVKPDGEAEGNDESQGGSGIVRIINAQESERQHLARQMHDGPAQSLTNLILQAEIVERLFDRDPQRARAELAVLKEAVTQTFQKVRGFIFDLRPMMLDDLGLNPTIKRYVQDFEAKSGIKCSLSLMGKEQRLPSHTEITVFRVLQGLLANVQRHANATQVDVLLHLDPQGLVATVEDNGCGFNVEEALARARQRKTLGLATMIEQVELLGGEITFDSAPRRGTRVQFRLPV